MYSIKRFLLINLLIGVAIIIGLSIMANIANEHSDFKLHLDAQLAMSAYTIESFLDENSDYQDLEDIQKKLMRLTGRKKNVEQNMSFPLICAVSIFKYGMIKKN